MMVLWIRIKAEHFESPQSVSKIETEKKTGGITRMTKIGCAWIDKKEILAGANDTWMITYEVGAYGLDDGGEILVSRRDVCDSDLPQFDDPKQPGYVRVTATGDASIRV